MAIVFNLVPALLLVTSLVVWIIAFRALLTACRALQDMSASLRTIASVLSREGFEGRRERTRDEDSAIPADRSASDGVVR